MEYKNFDLCIEDKLGDAYRVKAESETMGETNGLLTISPDCMKIAAELKNVEELEDDSNLPMNLGVSLYQCLFHNSVANMLNKSLGGVLLADDQGMRIRLKISPPEIAALPWEVLYDQSTRCFLSTSGKMPLTRYIQLDEPIKALKIEPPVKVLVLIPEGSGLEVGKEKAIITEALGELEPVEIRVLEGKVTRSAISRTLVEEQYHILHFIGHGIFESNQGYLVINSEQEERDLISADDFASFFISYPSLKLIVLNSCQGAEVSSTKELAGMAPQLVARGIPAVIAMQYPISDDAALTFAKEFYLKLCRGWSRGRVDTAISHARNRLHMDIKEPLAFATPVLFMRSPTGVIFDFEQELGRFRRLLELFASSPAKHVNRLKEVKKTHEKNVEVLHEKIKEASPEALEEAQLAIAEEKEQIAAVNGRIIRWNKTFLSASLASLIIFLLGYVGLFNFPFQVDDWLETKFIPYMEPYVTKKFSPDVRIILADEGDNSGLGEPGPSWRQYHAQLVDKLADAGAKVIVFDLEINSTTDYDAKFADAIKRAESKGTYVILGKSLDTDGTTLKDIAPELKRVVDGAEHDHWGNIKVGGQRGGFVRLYQLAQPVRSGSSAGGSTDEEAVVPSLALRAVAAFLSKDSSIKAVDEEAIQLSSDAAPLTPIPVTKNRQSVYDFSYDLAAHTRLEDATRSYSEVYQWVTRWETGRLEEYKDKIVVVGFKHDSFSVFQGEQRYGAEIHANVISNILSGVYIKTLPDSYDFLVVALMAGLGALVKARCSHVFSRTITLLLGEHRKKIDFPGPLFAGVLVYLLVAFALYRIEFLFILKSYHLVAPFIAYWLTGKMRRRAALRLS